MSTRENHKRKRPITEIGQDVPGNFKFGLIVAVAMFWADLFKAILSGIFSLINVKTPIVSDFILAVAATILGYVVLKSYRRLKSRLQKVEV